MWSVAWLKLPFALGPLIAMGALGALTLRPAGAVPASRGPAVRRVAVEEPPEACATWTSTYTLAVRVRLEDTPFGAGNGTYDAGKGKARLRFTMRPNETKPSRVELLSYETDDHFVVDSHVLFIHAKVTTNTQTRVTPASGVAAVGNLVGSQVVWTTPVKGYRTDGALTCEGSGCGGSGVPPKGTSEFHSGPAPVSFSPFRFDSDELDTFHMAYTKVSHTQMPRQTAFVSLAARRTSRECEDTK